MVLHEQTEDLVLDICHVDRFPILGHFIKIFIDTETPGLNILCRRFRLLFAPVHLVSPQKGFDPCQQLFLEKRFDQIIVAARLKALRLLMQPAFRRQKKNRCQRVLADPAAYLISIEIRQHHIQYDQVRLFSHLNERFFPCRSLQRIISFPVQQNRDDRTYILIVFHDHYCILHRYP